MKTATWMAGIVGLATIGVGWTVSAADGQVDLWTLANDYRSVHRLSTSIKAQEMKALLRRMKRSTRRLPGVATTGSPESTWRPSALGISSSVHCWKRSATASVKEASKPLGWSRLR